MDHHLRDFYSEFSTETQTGNFHKVIALHDESDVDWKEISSVAPTLPRGWYELANLPPQDRIEFTREFWSSSLPYDPILDSFLSVFFDSLDDVAVFLTQQKFDDPFHTEMVYSRSENRGFFRGGCPATEEDLVALQELFPDHILPIDYTAFLLIHDGFWKTTDCTGIIRSEEMKESYEKFQAFLEAKGPLSIGGNEAVDPKSLIPFYESFGMPFFQCFWTEWYPAQEMGNVYYSGESNTISSVDGDSSETLAFPRFIDWLVFYLEQIE